MVAHADFRKYDLPKLLEALAPLAPHEKEALASALNARAKRERKALASDGQKFQNVRPRKAGKVTKANQARLSAIPLTEDQPSPGFGKTLEAFEKG